MANEEKKFLDKAGVARLWGIIKTAIETAGNLKVDKSATGMNGTGTIQNNGVAMQLQFADGVYHNCYLHIGYNNILLDVQNNDENNIGDSTDPYGHMMFEITANDITFRRYGEMPTSIIDKLIFDSSPTDGSEAAITSDGVYHALLNVIGIAEGKTANVVVSYVGELGAINSIFNSSATIIKQNMAGAWIDDVAGNHIYLNTFRIGDIV